MIYKFKSKAAGDVIMLGPNGDQLLRIMGREPAAKGIIEVAAHAGRDRVRSRQAVAADEAARSRPPRTSRRRAAGARGVGLRQRAWPMIEMMRRSHAPSEPTSSGASDPQRTKHGADAMKLWSDSGPMATAFAERYAAGKPDGRAA